MLCISGGLLIDPKSGLEDYRNIYVEGKKIVSIMDPAEPQPEANQVIDATGCIVAPGLIDVHVHFRDPGLTHKEDIETGARAAAAGGYTTVVCMANTKPTVDMPETVRYVINKGKQTGIHVETCGSITEGLKGQKMTDMSEMVKAGASGFTDDGIPILSETLLYEAMEKAKQLNVPISLHEENPELISENGINAGEASDFYGIKGSPRMAEISMILRDLQIARKTDAKVNIQHISTKEGVELVREAKKFGGNIHAEGTPHHFSLTQQAVIEKGSLAKVNPPLREEADRLAVIEGIADNTIDMIATDHAPHSAEEKAQPITKAPSGMIGLETALPLAITYLYRKAGIPLKTVLCRMTMGPAEFYGFDRGYLAEGGPADLVIFSEKEAFTVDKFNSKATNSPFIGETLYGVVKATVCDGKVLYQQS